MCSGKKERPICRDEIFVQYNCLLEYYRTLQHHFATRGNYKYVKLCTVEYMYMLIFVNVCSYKKIQICVEETREPNLKRCNLISNPPISRDSEIWVGKYENMQYKKNTKNPQTQKDGKGNRTKFELQQW